MTYAENVSILNQNKREFTNLLYRALNIDTILMLPCVPNWRWDMNFRDTSIWYKSFKVIRQQTPGDWTLVMSKLSDHLSGLKNG